jgi:hypothetical protein
MLPIQKKNSPPQFLLFRFREQCLKLRVWGAQNEIENQLRPESAKGTDLASAFEAVHKNSKNSSP